MYEKAKIVTRGIIDLVMVLAGCEGNDNRLRIWERVVKCMVCHSGSSIFIRGYYLQCTNFLSLRDKESVIASTATPVHLSGRQEEAKTVSTFTRFSRPLTQSELAEWMT